MAALNRTAFKMTRHPAAAERLRSTAKESFLLTRARAFRSRCVRFRAHRMVAESLNPFSAGLSKETLFGTIPKSVAFGEVPTASILSRSDATSGAGHQVGRHPPDTTVI